MIIWSGIYLAGIVAVIIGAFKFARGVRRKEKRRAILAVVFPVFLWVGIYALFEAERRFIEEETRKNGGKTPDWVW